MNRTCIWKVDPKDRMCGYCTIRQCCHVRLLPDTKAEDIGRKYVEIIRSITGVNPLGNTRKKMAVWGRNMIAFQMSLDGFIQKDIAKAIGRDRCTVVHCIKSMDSALSRPKQYFNEVSIWNQFRDQISTIKEKVNV